MSTSENTHDNEFFAQFLDDYFAECDEHLSIVRRNLLALETFLDKAKVDRSLVEDLFRSFHTLKGISGMVGVTEAEMLAHHMENYLRALRREEAPLSSEGMDAMLASANALEMIISARRAETPPPDIASIIARLEAISSDHSPVNKDTGSDKENAPAIVSSKGDQIVAFGDEAKERIEAARNRGARVLRLTFTPSSELAAREINVNIIRGRIQEAGELIHAAPRVSPEGGVAFDFIMASNHDDSLFSQWQDDGVTCAEAESPDAPTALKRIEPLDDDKVMRPAQSLASTNMVRVDLARLDVLMRMVGDMVITRARLQDNIKRIESLVPSTELRALQETTLALERQLRDLREGVMRVRLVPIGETFERMHFVVRDAARESGKKVRIEMSGQGTEIDKLLVERMLDPLLHLVRNSVSHGIESPQERLAAGKSEEGTIALRAFTEGEAIIIQIEDDGRGMDAEKIAARAKAAGLLKSDQPIDLQTMLSIICASGFSTREQADRMSGRGVGMDVVKKAVEDLGGALTLDTQKGRGARFDIQLPLTLAIADALIVRVDDQIFAVPQSSVREIIPIESGQITALENNEVLYYRGGVLPLIRLARIFNLRSTADGYALVVGSESAAVGIVADHLLGQRDIVVRAITDPLIQVAGVTGATELGDGRAVLILDAAGLCREARRTAKASGGNQ